MRNIFGYAGRCAAAFMGGCVALGILLLATSAIAQQGNQSIPSSASSSSITAISGSPSTAVTFFPSTSSACTNATYSPTGTVFCAVDVIAWNAVAF
jgi:hypothetical protein